MSIKETIQKGQKKWKEFDEKHPWVKPVLVTCALFGVGYVGYDLICKKNIVQVKTTNWDSGNINAMMENAYNSGGGMIQCENGKDINFLPAKGETEDKVEEFKKFWEENYKDNWDEIMECVKRLELKQGEMFIIEDQKQYLASPDFNGGIDPEMPIISHLVDGTGVYPPED